MSRLTALLAILALSGCATSTTASPSASPTASASPEDRMRKIEVIKAACMKEKGFDYRAAVFMKREATEADRKGHSGDYAAMKEFRQKYGYGVFAMFVYPDAMGLNMSRAVKDPNADGPKKLEPGQEKAYRAAEDVCSAKAIKQVLNKDVSSMHDFFEQMNSTMERTRTRELNGDPKLVSLAATFGQCMKGKGYKIDALNPMAMGQRGRKLFESQLNKGNEEENGRMIMSGPQMTAEQAKPYLQREIKDAVDDLECGKEFYAVFMPKDQEISERVAKEIGP